MNKSLIAGPKRILLATANARFTHSSLALRYLRNAIQSTGRDHAVSLTEFQINQPRLQILQEIVLAAPDVLAFSVSIWNGGLVRSLLVDLRALLPDCLIILGGPEVSWSAADWLRDFPAINLIVSGAGEAALALLAAHDFDLDACRVAHPQAFLHLIAQGAGLVLSLPAPHFSTIAFPYTPEDFAALDGHYLYYETSRGCPFACAYCLSSRDDQALQMKNLDQVCREIDQILEHQPMLVKFVDRTFNADPQRARAIWVWLAGRDKDRPGSQVRFHFEVHPALLEPADFTILATVRPGLFQFEVGVQSVNPKALAAIDRRVDWPTAREAIRRLMALDTIHIHLDLIAGLPDEGLAEIGSSFDQILDLAPHHFQLGFLKALPGTSLREQAADYGLVYQSQAPYEILANRWLTVEDLAQLRLVEDLLEATWNAGTGKEQLAIGRERHGGSFRAFRSLADFARHTGYDVRTRQASKVLAFLDGWLAAPGLHGGKPAQRMDDGT